MDTTDDREKAESPSKETPETAQTESEEKTERTEPGGTRKLKEVWDRALHAFGKGADEITKISRVGKLKFDITKLERDRNKLFQDLGKDTYSLMKEERFDSSEVEKYLARIDNLNDQITSYLTEMKTKVER